jgi:hypothetical protein
MEASYATGLQWTGQDKKDIVACVVVHCVQVAKDRGQGKGRGGFMIMVLISSTNGRKIKKNG